MATLKAVRGTRDLLPPETALWNRIEATARAVFARYNFGEIRTPVFEDTTLFSRSVGEETDIVSKEMYTWEDRERFDLQSLINAWTTVQVKEKGFVIESAIPKVLQAVDKFGVKLILGRRNPERPEFWAFRAKVTREAVEGLMDAKQALRTKAILEFSADADYLRRFGPGLRLVVPAGLPAEDIELGEVSLEEFPGQFSKSVQSLTLRPENTAGVVRAYIEHKLGETGQLQKLYYIGPQFRRERPQKGRYRQFSQIGAEVIGPQSAGSESPLRDAEVLEMLATLLDEMGITGWTLEINSVGSSADRERYNETLRAALIPLAPKMCVDCQRRAVTNPLRVLDCKVPEDQPIIETLPKIVDSLDEASKTHFAAVLAALDAAGVPYTRNHRLVRGLDYYTRTTFEFTHGGLGAQNALLGGGRYDGLSEMLGGPKAPGIGFAIGADRLILVLQEQAETDVEREVALRLDAYIAPIGAAQEPNALRLARDLRARGLRVDLGEGTWKARKHFDVAERRHARCILFLGENEVRDGTYSLKRLNSSSPLVQNFDNFDLVVQEIKRASASGKIRRASCRERV